MKRDFALRNSCGSPEEFNNQSPRGVKKRFLMKLEVRPELIDGPVAWLSRHGRRCAIGAVAVTIGFSASDIGGAR
jgi:hypothetical protein